MTIRKGEFAFFNGRAVAVKKIEGDMVEILHIQRDIHNKKEWVSLEKLVPFTTARANKMISEYNMRIHAIKECLQYHEGE